MLSTNPVTTTLIKAREMIADPKNWCQGYAISSNGTNFSYCAFGVITYGLNEKDLFPIFKALNRAAGQLFGKSNAAYVNDKLGHTATLQMFDRAIENSLRGESLL